MPKKKREENERMKEKSGGRISPFPNKYELAIIAAREARRMNEFLKRSSEEPKEKVTLKAMERVVKGGVHYAYDDEQGKEE
ncbi:MAG: DNA-directed RNA polymerase subunit omega [Candidatus Eisenbacteria bacterium]